MFLVHTSWPSGSLWLSIGRKSECLVWGWTTRNSPGPLICFSVTPGVFSPQLSLLFPRKSLVPPPLTYSRQVGIPNPGPSWLTGRERRPCTRICNGSSSFDTKPMFTTYSLIVPFENEPKVKKVSTETTINCRKKGGGGREGRGRTYLSSIALISGESTG